MAFLGELNPINSPIFSYSSHIDIFQAVMTSMAVSSLLAALDASAVSTAMPSMINDLGSSQAYTWIANAYLLTMTAFTPLFGQTADIFGRRSLTLLAIILFAVGSAICGPAPNLGALVAGRAIQGIGAAGLNTMVEIVVCDLVPLRERGKFMGYIFAIYGLGTSIGPVIGGVFAGRVTWRWVFYLNLPLAGLSLLLVGLSLNTLPKKHATVTGALKVVDFSGNTILVAAVTSVLLALTWGGGEQPWSSWRTILPLVLGLFGLLLFLLIQSQVSHPTTPLRLFSNRTSFTGFWLAFSHHVLIYWILFVLPIYFQAVLENNPLISGVNLLPTAIATMPFAILGGVFLSKLGHFRPLHFAGFSLFALAIGLFTRLDESSSTGYWVGIQLLGAAAMGILTVVTLPTILAPLPESDVATATAAWAFMRGFGTIWGAAIPLAVLNTRVDALVKTRVEDETLRRLLSKGGAYALASGGSVYSQTSSQKATVKGIYVDSLKLCWQVGLAFAFLGLALALLAKEVPMRAELETEFGMVDEAEKSRTGQPEGQPCGAAAISETLPEDRSGKA